MTLFKKIKAMKELRRIRAEQAANPVPVSPTATKVSFYIDVYKEGDSWICEEGDIYSDNSRRVKTKDCYKTENEAYNAKIMQLH